MKKGIVLGIMFIITFTISAQTTLNTTKNTIVNKPKTTVSTQNTTVKTPQYEYKVVTSVESIVPSGFGRSRIISSLEDKDHKKFTSERSEDDNGRNKSKRKEIRVKNFEETKLLNFYNIAGIRFQNIAANDALITSKINEMILEGWDLVFVVSGVESDSGENDGQGIFITRYIFKRVKKS